MMNTGCIEGGNRQSHTSPAPRCASRTGWPCRRATCTWTRLRVRRRPCSTGHSWLPGRAGLPASGRARRSAPACARSWPTVQLADVDYVSVADGATLRELEHVEGPALLSMAVAFGSTRLIDNEILDDGIPDGPIDGRPHA